MPPFDDDGQAIMSRRAALIRAALASAGVAALSGTAHAQSDEGPESVEPGAGDVAADVGGVGSDAQPDPCLSIAKPEPEVCLCAGTGDEGAKWLAVPAAAVVIARQVTKRSE